MTLPDWLKALPDAVRMRAIDSWAIEEQEIPSLDLMERAGRGLATLAAEIMSNGQIAVVCGKGNNGGDGFVAARHLAQWGHSVEVLLCGDIDEIAGEALINLERLDARPSPFEAQRLGSAELVVDALFGTGFSGEPHGVVAEAITAINQVALPVVAADVPSGVNASTGEADLAIAAVATATFHSLKLGLKLAPGKQLAGRVEVIDIGIPLEAPVDSPAGLINSAVLTLVPHRTTASTKFSAGVVVVVGGSTGLTGAPCLAANAAQRSGAGYVTAAVPTSLNRVFEEHLLEAMTVPLPDFEGALTPDAVEPALAALAKAGALALGPGLGRRKESLAFARELTIQAEMPLVLDADGLNAYAGRLSDLTNRKAPTVLTPHAGELARLLETEATEVEARRLEHATRAAKLAAAVVVLKGDDTIIATPDGQIAVSPGGCPALATAGSGDVLSGIIGAFLAKGMPAFEAASAGVYAHLRAGQLASHGKTEGMIASDVVDHLPLVF